MIRDALDFFLDPAIILCVSGTIIFIVAFFGFVGALRENVLLLKIVSDESLKIRRPSCPQT